MFDGSPQPSTPTCAYSGCGKPSVAVPKLLVPERAVSFQVKPPIGLILNMPCCLDHVREFDAPAMFKKNPKLVAIVTELAKQKGPPDFSRARVAPVYMKSPEFAHYQRMQQRAANEPGPGETTQ